mmetsp:Transcript_10345/g.26051  ORF Transcript_10345/g.26051 Transcript_10345/m.26051 type:complete len:202 (-) Transcript_10345:202-807(-)
MAPHSAKIEPSSRCPSAAASGARTAAWPSSSSARGAGRITSATPRSAPNAQKTSVQCQRSPRKHMAIMDDQTGADCMRVAASPRGSREIAWKPNAIPQKPNKPRRQSIRTCTGCVPNQSRTGMGESASRPRQKAPWIEPRASMTWKVPKPLLTSFLTISACKENPRLDATIERMGTARWNHSAFLRAASSCWTSATPAPGS